jgi:hypothetical protein
MKLGKEEIQKIVLGVLLLCGLIYVYFAFLLGPLQASHAASRARIDAAKGKLAASKAQIARTAKLETTAPGAALMVKQLTAMMPDGSPVAWFPILVSDFFRQYGFDRVQTHLLGDAVDKELTNFRQTSWTIDLPNADFAAAGQAIAGLENEQPLIEITHMDLEFLKDAPETLHISMSVNNVVKP